MVRPIITLRRRRVLVDVDTQKDFFLAENESCVRNHRRILQNIRRTIAWARMKNIRMISTKQIYDQGNGHSWCLAGTEGQRKISYTVRDRKIAYPADGSTDLPRDILRQYDQVIFYKRTEDPFDEPRADRLFSELKADEFILIGATMEGSIKHTALGLIARKKRVTLMTDAIGCIDKIHSEIALRQLEAKGATLKEAKTLLGTTHLQQVGVCGCERCLGLMQKKPALKTGT